MNSISANLNVMIKASQQASKILIRDFGEVEKLQVSIKSPSDFVTNADLKTEKIIINELSKARPSFSIISEEAGYIDNKDKENIWVIDPIDGTTNLLHGIPHFAISIALLNKSEVISGLIYDPIKDEMFYAEKNQGAYLNNKRIRVSKKKNLKDCLFATNSSKNEKDIEIKKFETSVRKSGSAALDMAYVASGRYDGYFQKNLNLWDIAAGIVMVSESGGKTNKINLDIHKNIKIIASSTSIYNKLIENLVNF